MDIYYISPTRFPSEKAHSLYIAKACEAFVDGEHNVVQVIVPRRFLATKECYSTFYGMNPSFSVMRLPCLDLFLVPRLRSVAFYFVVASFALSCCFYALFKISRTATIFSHDALTAWLLTYVHERVVYEMHDYPNGSLWLYERLLKRVYKIQTNNSQKQLLLQSQFQVPKSKMYTAHNGVSVKDFDLQMSQYEARDKLGLCLSDKIVVYTGSFLDWKGVDVLADTAALLPSVTFLFIGGNNIDVSKMELEYNLNTNIQFLGFKPHAVVPLYQKAADVLVVPNTAKKDISRLHTSPMKIFEYMASRTPIVATNIPSIREILNESNSVLCEPDNPVEMARVIYGVIHSKDTQRITDQSFEEVKKHTWIMRGKKILNNLV